METKRIKIDELACDPANVRAHDGKNLDAIKGSLQRFGQQKPIVIDGKGIVVAGNGTLTAARALGWDAINIVRTELAGSEATAYAIADNRTAELAEWDDEALAKQLSALQIEDEALVEAAGFSDAELTALVDEVMGITEGNTDPDEVPEVPEAPTVQPGQIWRLGNHRLMCGDSTISENVAALMDGQKADMVFTDPPYGINYESVSIAPELLGTDKKSKKEKILGDEDTSVFRSCYNNVISHIDCPVIIWGANYFTDILPVNGHWIVWNKLKFDKPGQNFSHCEIAYTSFKKNMVTMYSHTWDGAFREGSRKDEGATRIHPNQKPVGMFSRILSDYDKSKILDLFLGSGSTLIACEQTGRKCYGMELSPAYCDVIIRRWEDFTGQTAELVDG